MTAGRPPSHRPARFTNVGPRPHRTPSWLAAQKPGARPRESVSLRPARLPEEFVHAIRQGLQENPSQRRPPSGEMAALSAPSLELERAAGRREHPPVSAEQHAEYDEAPPSETGDGVAVDPALIEGFQQALELLAATRTHLLEQTAAQIAELAAAIARRVIAHELSVDPAIVEGLVLEGLDALAIQDRVVIRLGRCFTSACEGLERKIEARGLRCEVILDPALGDYGCEVQTELGHVDESVEARLENLLEALRPRSDVP